MQRGYDYKQHAVLYIDDEEQALKYFDRAMSKDLDVLTATSAKAGWQIIEADPDRIGVVITDQRMPSETGVDLLEKVRSEHPQIVRILTTAYADLDSAIEAVNSGAIFQYVTKPWVLRDLRGVLLRAMEFYLVQRDRDRLLREKLTTIQRLFMLDRVRALAVVGAGFGGRVRQPLGAIRAFCEAAVEQGMAKARSDGAGGEMDLWSMMLDETQRLIGLVERVAGDLVDGEPTYADGVRLDEVIRSAVDGEKSWRVTAIEIDDDLPQLRADQRMLKALVRCVCEQVSRAGGPDASVVIRASAADIGQGGGVAIQFTGGDGPWPQERTRDLFAALAPSANGGEAATANGLLAAYLIAHHHGGDIAITSPESEPGSLTVRLRTDPSAADADQMSAGWLDDVLSEMASEFE